MTATYAPVVALILVVALVVICALLTTGDIDR